MVLILDDARSNPVGIDTISIKIASNDITVDSHATIPMLPTVCRDTPCLIGHLPYDVRLSKSFFIMKVVGLATTRSSLNCGIKTAFRVQRLTQFIKTVLIVIIDFLDDFLEFDIVLGGSTKPLR